MTPRAITGVGIASALGTGTMASFVEALAKAPELGVRQVVDAAGPTSTAARGELAAQSAGIVPTAG